MDQSITFIIIGLLALLAGIVAGKFIFAKNTKKQVEEAELQAQKIISEAEAKSETIKKEKILNEEDILIIKHIKSNMNNKREYIKEI